MNYFERRDLIFSTILPSSEKLVLLYLHSLYGDNDHCWPSARKIAEKIGMTICSVRRLLASLSEKKAIKTKHRRDPEKGNQSSLYSINWRELGNITMKEGWYHDDRRGGIMMIGGGYHDDTLTSNKNQQEEPAPPNPPKGGRCRTSSSSQDRPNNGQAPTSKGRAAPTTRKGEARQRKRIDEFGLRCAKRLARAVHEKTDDGVGMDRINKWVPSFAKLRDDDRISEERITEVLDWYVRNIGRERMKIAYCGSSFKRKFHEIAAIMEMKQNGNGTTDDIEIGENARYIADKLRGLGWPKGSADQLPATAQESLDNYGAFLDRCEHLRNNGVGQDLKAFCKHLSESLSDPVTFVEGWLEEVFDSVHDWDAWSGNLRARAVRVQGKRFQQLGRDWSREWSGDECFWKDLMKEV